VTCDPRRDPLIPRGPRLRWTLAGPSAELEPRRSTRLPFLAKQAMEVLTIVMLAKVQE
jgi:hypothetical protein